MKVSIIGHGPSLDNAGRGEEIDSFDKVVRLKGAHTVLGTEDYGTRSDVLCSSTEIMGCWLQMTAEEYWGYPKKGMFNGPRAMAIITTVQKPCMIPLELTNHWNEFFRGTKDGHYVMNVGYSKTEQLVWKIKISYPN